MPRVHIFGASGSGTTTLGRTIAQAWGCAHFDTDNFFWFAGDPPYGRERPILARTEMLAAALDSCEQWVSTGSLTGWGDFAIPQFELVVFLHLDPEERLARLQRREAKSFGARIEPGGDMHTQNAEFLAWAAKYDTAGLDMRSQARHEQWLGQLKCPILRLNSADSVANLAIQVFTSLPQAPF